MWCYNKTNVLKCCPLGGSSGEGKSRGQLSVCVMTIQGKTLKLLKDLLPFLCKKIVIWLEQIKVRMFFFTAAIFFFFFRFSFLEHFSVLQLVLVIWCSSLMETAIPSFSFHPWSSSTWARSQVSTARHDPLDKLHSLWRILTPWPNGYNGVAEICRGVWEIGEKLN